MKITGTELHQPDPGMSRTSSRKTSSPDFQKPGTAKAGLPLPAPESSEKASSMQAGSNSTRKLDPEELAVINELKQTDRKVRAHEAAHVAAGGKYVTGGPSFEYETGPDGKQYAVGGEVSIDTSKVPGDPEATIAKMEAVRKAALAPASPSSQDRAVAATATRVATKARLEANEDTEDGSKTEDNNQIGQNIDRKA